MRDPVIIGVAGCLLLPTSRNMAWTEKYIYMMSRVEIELTTY